MRNCYPCLLNVTATEMEGTLQPLPGNSEICVISNMENKLFTVYLKHIKKLFYRASDKALAGWINFLSVHWGFRAFHINQ